MYSCVHFLRSKQREQDHWLLFSTYHHVNHMAESDSTHSPTRKPQQGNG